MSSDGLPKPCLNILRWLKGLSADPMLGLAKESAPLRDVLKQLKADNRGEYTWADYLRLLDDAGAIEVQVLVKPNHWNVQSIANLYSNWYSPLGIQSSPQLSRKWDDIVRQATIQRPSKRYSTTLPRTKDGGSEPITRSQKEYFQGLCATLRQNGDILLESDEDCLRVTSPRIRITERGRLLLARADRGSTQQREEQDERGTPLTDSIPVVWLRRQVSQKVVKGDSTKLKNWLKRRKCDLEKIANKWHVERSDALKHLGDRQDIQRAITDYGQVEVA